MDEFVALEGAANLSIKSCQDKWLKEVTEKVKLPDVKWFTKNAFIQRKSGLATLVTLRFDEGNWYAKALGDSFLFFIPQGKNNFEDWVYLSSKYSSSKPESVVFDSYPDYYSSREEKNGTEKEISGKLKAGRFYLMTDALSEWVFNEKQKALNEIRRKWNSQSEFECSIDELRQLNSINNDDSSILIIDLEDDGKKEFKYKTIDVKKIDDLIKNEKKDDVKEEETINIGVLKKQETPILEVETRKKSEEQENISAEKSTYNNNEQLTQKIEEKFVVINKKVNGLLLLNGVLFLVICGLFYVFSENIKDLKQRLPIKNEEVSLKASGQAESTMEQNYWKQVQELPDIAKFIKNGMEISNKAKKDNNEEISKSELTPISKEDSLNSMKY